MNLQTDKELSDLLDFSAVSLFKFIITLSWEELILCLSFGFEVFNLHIKKIIIISKYIDLLVTMQT